MTKMFAHVDGYFPDMVFNRHAAPASQTEVLDDFLADDYDSYGEGGFVGGATLGIENGLMPIQISRQSLPPDVPRWGKGYKDHLREWQHWCTIRLQPDTLSYQRNFLDLDPRYRDKSGLGLPLVRITYDLRENEQRLAEHLEGKAEEILREMGATKTWRGPASPEWVAATTWAGAGWEKTPPARWSIRSSACTTRPGSTSSAAPFFLPARASTPRSRCGPSVTAPQSG